MQWVEITRHTSAYPRAESWGGDEMRCDCGLGSYVRVTLLAEVSVRIESTVVLDLSRNEFTNEESWELLFPGGAMWGLQVPAIDIWVIGQTGSDKCGKSEEREKLDEHLEADRWVKQQRSLRNRHNKSLRRRGEDKQVKLYIFILRSATAPTGTVKDTRHIPAGAWLGDEEKYKVKWAEGCSSTW